MDIDNILSETLYNYAKHKLLSGFYSWLFKQELEDLKEILKQEKEIVSEINRQYTDEDIEKIPKYLRQVIVNHLPKIKDKLIRDTISDLKNDETYYILIEINKSYLYELLERSLNMLYIRARESLE